MNKEQVLQIAELMSHDKMYFQGTYESNPDYENFLEKTFGKDWLEFHQEFWERGYDFEFEYDWYVYQVTGLMSQEMKEWVEEGLELLKDFEPEVVDEE